MRITQGLTVGTTGCLASSPPESSLLQEFILTDTVADQRPGCGTWSGSDQCSSHTTPHSARGSSTAIGIAAEQFDVCFTSHHLLPAKRP
jgi:hypothetical protein